ncbi:divalent metal cation transporter [Sulfobacillus thermotolerans]|uniref:divalent metal cation transporter n=1 Tax=Sulfobacillus thermotolerans TaxID=338644 RepID=UPI00336730BA
MRHGRIDTTLGAALAAIAALGCIIATAPLYVHHMNASQFGTAQFAQALVPYVGRIGGALFALGVLEAGLVAATVISTSSAYAFGEVTRTAHSLNRSFREAKGFYLILIGIAAVAGALVLLPGFPLEMVVIMVNVIAVLTMPPAIGFLLILANDREIMGPHRSTWWLNAMGLTVGIFVTTAGIIYAISVIFPRLF